MSRNVDTARAALDMLQVASDNEDSLQAMAIMITPSEERRGVDVKVTMSVSPEGLPLALHILASELLRQTEAASGGCCDAHRTEHDRIVGNLKTMHAMFAPVAGHG